MNTKDAILAAAQEAWKQKNFECEKKFTELKQKVNDRSADIQKVEKFTCSASGLEPNLASSQSKNRESKEKLLASSERLETIASVSENAD